MRLILCIGCSLSVLGSCCKDAQVLVEGLSQVLSCAKNVQVFTDVIRACVCPPAHELQSKLLQGIGQPPCELHSRADSQRCRPVLGQQTCPDRLPQLQL